MRWSTVNRIKSQLDPAGRVWSDSGDPIAKHADLCLFKHKTTSLKGPYISQKSIFFSLFFSLQPFTLSLPIKYSLLSLKRFKRILEFPESDHHPPYRPSQTAIASGRLRWSVTEKFPGSSQNIQNAPSQPHKHEY